MKSLNLKEYKIIRQQCFEIAKEKNADYGCETMLDFGPLGIVVRLNDKMHRLKNLIQKKKVPKVNESLEDTAMDMINYATYLVMILRDKLHD